MSSAVLYPLLASGGSATVITSGLGAVAFRALKRVAEAAVRDGTADIRNDVTDLKVKFASETGGNSNGLRQAVNELAGEVSDIRVDVAHLKGVAEGQAAKAAA